MSKTKSVLHEIAGLIAAKEAKKHQASIGDIREILAILKKQHSEACKGNASWLLKLLQDSKT
jgi:hypothetical protein